MTRANEARQISEKRRAQLEWGRNASDALVDAMMEIESAAKRGDFEIRVIGMDDKTARVLRSYGYSLEQEAITPRYERKKDGTYVCVSECTKISW